MFSLVSESRIYFICVPKSFSMLYKRRYSKKSYSHLTKTKNGRTNSTALISRNLNSNDYKRYQDSERIPPLLGESSIHPIKTNCIVNWCNRKLLRTSQCIFGNHLSRFSSFDTCVQARSYTTSSVNETLAQWTKKLEAASVPEAKLSAEYIIAHVLGVPRKDLNILGESQISEEVFTEADRLMTCRLARMPLQYIIGDWDFHSVTIKTRPPVFIPRPETEQLVELGLECLKGIERPKVLDIGCGSGAISLALLKNISNLKCVALDHSKHAIELTEENATILGVRQRLLLVQGKVTMEGIPTLPYDEFDLIISNPPYVLRKDLMNVQPEIMIYEDMRALDGGKEGLDVVKPILLHFQHVLSTGKHLLLEVDPCHQYLVPQWMKTQKDMEIKVLEILKDFHGKERFLKFVKGA